jgi:hypothetical protein
MERLRIWLGIGLVAAAAAAMVAAPAAATLPEGRNGLIAVQSDGGVGEPNLWTLGADGSAPTNRTNTPAPAFEDAPVFSPNGEQIFYVTETNLVFDIRSMNADGSGQTPLFAPPAGQQIRNIAVAPDGSSLVFAQTSDFQVDLYRRTPDGAITRLTNTPTVSEEHPDFSPDGRLIAYSTCVDVDPCDVAVMNADGSAPRNLTNTPAVWEENPAFSPDGDKLVFQLLDDFLFTGDIWTMNADGSAPAQLTIGTSLDDFNPVYAGDGRSIVFERCDAQCDLFSIPPGGGAAANLTPAIPFNVHDPGLESIQRCGKKEATIVGDDGPDKIKGTKRKDVIDANGGKNKIKSRGGNDTICAGKKAKISCGGGNDRVIGKFKSAKGCERGKGL